MKNILFIGAGNMASAIAGGIINSKIAASENIILFDKIQEQYKKFNSCCRNAATLCEGIENADYIFISVKPQNAKDILSKIKESDYLGKVFISICAGITISSIESYLPNAKIIRTMPNTPLMLGMGVTGICKNDNVTDEEFEFAKAIFSSSGMVSEIQENDINNLTAITSSSPAYFYLFVKGMLDGAKALGFDNSATVEMICQTMIGSANMILTSDKSIDDLITMVKSPNGTTERALNVFNDNNITDTIFKAMKACADRAEELSKIN